MTTRIIVGLIALPLVLAPIWFGGVWCLILLLVVALAGGVEFFGLLDHGGYRPLRWIGLLWIGGLVATGWQPGLPLAVPLITVGLVVMLVISLFQREQPVHTWLATSGGAIYLGLMLGHVMALRQLPAGLWWLLYGLLITWTNDTAAYFAGVTLGRRRLWPRLSPKKTWEGTVAGWVGAALMGGVLMAVLPVQMPIAYGAALGALGGVFALLGDLAVSMVKRQVRVKDSGHLIPGHGGALDRLDSLLFVLPLIYYVVWYGLP
ncbi:MAG: phosphatidate cytidylyltransferase [Chloroflexi bacterium]|nr:MAG: phosphatidate cytidylyltransferase [Chloroflexota bacterium]